MGQQESRKAQLEIDGKPQPEMIADPIYQAIEQLSGENKQKHE